MSNDANEKNNFINERFLVDLVRNSVFNAPLPQVPEELDWEYVFHKAGRHSVRGLCYNAAAACNMPEKVYSAWTQAYYMALRKQALFDCEREEIFALFEEKGIDYMPLKGIIINKLYPDDCVREFTDNDVLVSEKDLTEIRKIMEERGYDYSYSVNHDTYCKKPVYNYEFHYTLVSRRQKEKQYFNDAWSRAVQESGRCYKMTDEDFYCYNLAHLEKHFNGAGAGIRSLMDIYLIRREFCSKPDFDRAKVDKILKLTGLTEFEKHILYIAENFVNGTMENVKEQELDFIFRSGVHGSDLAKAKRTVEKKGKVKYFLSRVFPDVEHMSYNYPVLRKHPVFLPFCWIARIFSSIFNKNKRNKALNQYKEAIKTKKDDFTDEF